MKKSLVCLLSIFMGFIGFSDHALAASKKTQKSQQLSEKKKLDLGQMFRNYGTDKDIPHGYTTVYHVLFDHLKSEPITLLEIGIGTMIPGTPSSMVGYAGQNYKPGGSLRAWRDYFVNGTIYGVDIQPDTQFNDEPRIVTHLCNSTDRLSVEEFMQKLGNIKFDIIIDDGSHVETDQLNTLSNFYPYLKENGTYIIEDICRQSSLYANPQEISKFCDNDPYFFAGIKDPFCIIYKSKLDRNGLNYRY